jgi:hypothetical protein
MLTVLTQPSRGLFSLADAENAIDRWKPFWSLAAPASSAATPAKRSPRTASYRSHLTIDREAMPISCAGVRFRSVISTVERVTGHVVPVVHAARRPGDPPVLVADASLAHDLIGFERRLSQLESIVATAWQARMRDRFGKA